MFRGLTFALAFTFTASFVQLTATTAVAIDLQPTTTIYLPNITKMLGGQDGWNTPFIVQNVGASATNLTFEFRRFSDGAVVKSRTVAGLAPGTSVFHCPNCDNELAAGGQYSVVIKSFGSPVVAVVNEHQNEANPQRQEGPCSHCGLEGKVLQHLLIGMRKREMMGCSRRTPHIPLVFACSFSRRGWIPWRSASPVWPCPGCC